MPAQVCGNISLCCRRQSRVGWTGNATHGLSVSEHNPEAWERMVQGQEYLSGKDDTEAKMQVAGREGKVRVFPRNSSYCQPRFQNLILP